ncbi:hypothetical protein KAR91_66725 [Candidatus Pacearchaeota archaeon]|nr:hypothetical protein [Candidatus Pacearchaeota archaeon]
MNKNDLERFITEMTFAGDIYSKNLHDGAMLKFFTLLSDHPIDLVVNALNAHMKDPSSGMYAPKPADLIRKIEGEPLTAEEILQAAIKSNTPMGILAADVIGSFEMRSLSRSDLLKIAKGIVSEVRDWQRKYNGGSISAHALKIIESKGVSTSRPFRDDCLQSPADYVNPISALGN